MITYRVAEPKDMDELIDLINMVFSMVRIPHDFPAILPKVYGGSVRRSDVHIVAHEDGKLCGVLGLLPFDLNMGERTLRCGYLGSMAVHPRVRGRGTMGELMRRQVERGKALGMDLLVLGGQRQRYENSGFSACGSRIRYSISRANVRHALCDVQAENVTLHPMEPGSEDEAAAFALYSRQPVTGARTKETFLMALRSYGNEPWAIRVWGKPCGYLMASRDGRCIFELVTENEEQLAAAVKAWLTTRDVSPVTIVAQEHETQLNALLAPICEGCSISADEMYLCLNPKKVISACMRLKAMYAPLENGVFRLGFGQHGTLEIRVSDGNVTVESTRQQPEIALSDQGAHAFVFGVNRTLWRHEDAMAPKGWFPLALQIPEADRF